MKKSNIDVTTLSSRYQLPLNFSKKALVVFMLMGVFWQTSSAQVVIKRSLW